MKFYGEFLFMKNIIIATFLMSLTSLACGTASTSTLESDSSSIVASSPALVVGYQIKEQKVSFLVSVNDCDKDSDFETSWLESFPGQLLLVEKPKSPCTAQKRVKEISVPSSEEFFTVANPIELQKKSYQCQLEVSSSPSRLFQNKKGAWDLPQKDESLMLTITHQGCEQGTKVTLTNWNEAVNGLTGKFSRDIKSQTTCVEHFGPQAAILAGSNGALAVGISEVENGVIKSVRVAKGVHQGIYVSQQTLTCSPI